MIFRLQPVHVQIDSGFENFAAEKFTRLERFFTGEPEVHLIVKKEKFEFILEAKIQYRSLNIFMKTKSSNLNTGLDDLVNKLKNHLSKLHDKKHNKKNIQSPRGNIYSPVVANETQEEQT
jgi:ribosomal subunit interface protein